MIGRPLFQATLKGENHSGRPPLWVMRQAGRYLPEYRALKEKYSFVEMVKTPALATEVTLQPLRRFDLDAAIVFSDILVIPEAMGQGYDFRPAGGIEMTSKLVDDSSIDKLTSFDIEEKLSYVSETLRTLRQELGDQQALLGFCGSPWTLACYMIEGGSADGFPKALAWADKHPKSFDRLLEKITQALVDYLTMQAKCGVDALQIFDSWHNLCPPGRIWDLSLKWIARLIEQVPQNLPLIIYANAPVEGLKEIVLTKPQALGIHHRANIAQARNLFPAPLVLQGNLDPEVMETDPNTVINKTVNILDSMKNDPAHIMNLGHGIRPGAKIECMQALVSTVKAYGS